MQEDVRIRVALEAKPVLDADAADDQRSIRLQPVYIVTVADAQPLQIHYSARLTPEPSRTMGGGVTGLSMGETGMVRGFRLWPEPRCGGDTVTYDFVAGFTHIVM